MVHDRARALSMKQITQQHQLLIHLRIFYQPLGSLRVAQLHAPDRARPMDMILADIWSLERCNLRADDARFTGWAGTRTGLMQVLRCTA